MNTSMQKNEIRLNTLAKKGKSPTKGGAGATWDHRK